jgi:hypothetical protein
MFYQKYRRFIKHPYRCGFSFVKCCERVHFKLDLFIIIYLLVIFIHREMYETPVQAVDESESVEAEADNEGVHRYDWTRHEQSEQDPIRVGHYRSCPV